MQEQTPPEKPSAPQAHREALDQSQEAAEDLSAFYKENPNKEFEPLGEKYQEFRKEQLAIREKSKKIKKLIQLEVHEIANKTKEDRLAGGNLKEDVLGKLAKQLKEEDVRPSRTRNLREQYLAILEGKEEKPAEAQSQSPGAKEAQGETAPEGDQGPPIPETTPGKTPSEGPEKGPRSETSPETARSEKELREELSLHESIARDMKKLVEKGQKAKGKLGVSGVDLDEYFPVIAADVIRSYSSDSKEIARRLDLDSKLFLDMFEQRIELLASEKLPEEIKKRVFEKQGVKGFEAFYRKITDQNGKLKSQEVLHVLRGQIANIAEKKETGIAQQIKETLRRQLELAKEYMTLRKFQLRQGEINQILGEALSEREREPLKAQERGAYEAAERLANELPEDTRNKKPGDFFGGLRRGGLQIKKVLRNRLR